MTTGKSGGPIGEIDQIIKIPMLVDSIKKHHDGTCTLGFFPLAQEKTTPELWTNTEFEYQSPGCFELRTDNQNIIDSVAVGQVFDFKLEPNMELTNKWYSRDARTVLTGKASRGR